MYVCVYLFNVCPCVCLPSSRAPKNPRKRGEFNIFEPRVCEAPVDMMNSAPVEHQTVIGAVVVMT